VAPDQEVVYEGTSTSASNLSLLWWWIWGHWYWHGTMQSNRYTPMFWRNMLHAYLG
jgi:hypothetical protein